ncbi:Adenosylhomocysteinase [Legionella steigerwaltii]|uniref:Adenosylhomocysteinase n=1 Tax=Legionella steigerwaltii TaxID=460 RepID=A0A378LAD5_9GAMM|nr:NAD-binding protein [Legionella steigerwaltii]KTD77456.1 Adenosylhomocysteinase [Legionella steigerwaltii]STY22689.1 Adenosylhomocysteinase [Legionella steigerwaltii]
MQDKHIRSWSEIDVKAKKYYDKIIKLCKENLKIDDNVTFLVVDHCLQTFETHVDSIAKLGKIAGVILKSSTHVKEAEEFAAKNCKLLDVTKEALKDPKVAIDLILANTKPGEKLVIMDHGGYFSYVLKELMEHPEVSKRLVGIAEVTENGHYKLDKALKVTAMPNLSVARSNIKELEDAQTGVAICDASNTILYGVHSALNSLQHACVIGYGKIGRSIANSCRKRGIPDVTVIEIDPLRAQLAMIDGHQVVMGTDKKAKALALQKAQILFSATGSKVLSAKDIADLRKIDRSSEVDTNPVLFIASCTSPDDEFSDDFFKELAAQSKNSAEDRQKCEEAQHLSPYKLFDGRTIYVLNEGKSVNFAIGGTPGFEICQVWAGVLYTAAKLAAQDVKPSHSVQELSRDEERAIGAVTQAVFFGKDCCEKATKPKETETSTPPKASRIHRSHSFSDSSFGGSSGWFAPKTAKQGPSQAPQHDPDEKKTRAYQ